MYSLSSPFVLILFAIGKGYNLEFIFFEK